MADPACFIASRIEAEPKSSVAVWSGPGFDAPLYCLEPGEDRLPNPRIPAGTYPLRLRTAGKKHDAYLKRYGPQFHKGMIEICDVPGGRTAIEFHIGNFIADTLGCSLAGMSFGRGADGHYRVGESAKAYEKFYPIICKSILAGRTQLIITDLAGVS